MNTTQPKRIHLPEPELPERYTSDIEFLEHRVTDRLRYYLENRRPYYDEMLCRVKTELALIARGYPEYLLIMNHMINWARSNRIQVNVEQGAVCSSCVAYLLGWISANPLLKHLHYEKFINPLFADGWLPDVYLEVPEADIPKIHAHLIELLGRDHFARIKDYPRGFVLCEDKISDILPVIEGEDGFPLISAPVSEVLKADLCKFDIDPADRHPIEIECLRETNGVVIYHEQIADMINLMSGKSYAWAIWAEKCLAFKNLQSTERQQAEFVEGCLANPMFRQRRWKDEHTARKYAESLWAEWSKNATRLFMRTHVASGDKSPRFATSRTVVGEVSFQDVAVALNRGERVAIIVRHAERPPLEKNDPTFGKDLKLTEHGIEQAKTFGFALSQFIGTATHAVYAGDNKRCTMTAMHLLCELHDKWGGTAIEHELGDRSPYFGDTAERLALADEGDYHELLNEYFRTGVQRGFNPLKEATDRFENFIWSQHCHNESRQLEIFVTHDINVAAFLAGRGVATRFEDYNWPGFMDAAVAFIGPCGRARYGYMRTHENRFGPITI